MQANWIAPLEVCTTHNFGANHSQFVTLGSIIRPKRAGLYSEEYLERVYSLHEQSAHRSSSCVVILVFDPDYLTTSPWGLYLDSQYMQVQSHSSMTRYSSSSGPNFSRRHSMVIPYTPP